MSDKKLQEILDAGYWVRISGGASPVYKTGMCVEVSRHGRHVNHIIMETFQQAIHHLHEEAFPPKPLTNKELIEKIEKWVKDIEYHRSTPGEDMTFQDEGESGAISKFLNYLEELKAEK